MAVDRRDDLLLEIYVFYGEANRHLSSSVSPFFCWLLEVMKDNLLVVKLLKLILPIQIEWKAEQTTVYLSIKLIDLHPIGS